MILKFVFMKFFDEGSVIVKYCLFLSDFEKKFEV